MGEYRNVSASSELPKRDQLDTVAGVILGKVVGDRASTHAAARVRNADCSGPLQDRKVRTR